jgi:outer membrane protein OmpA-like peptidoglycan-associated protein
MSNKMILMLMTVVFLASTFKVQAQEYESEEYQSGWYMGVQIGTPYGKSNFSSWGADKLRLGWSAGLHAGYTFSRMLSLEFSANWGKQVLTVQDCCFDRNYFLGEDFKRYRVAPAGMNGYYYNDLKSAVFLHRYAFHANVNVLTFFEYMKDSPWKLDASPVIYAVFSNTDLKTKGGNVTVREGVGRCNLGLGGQMQLSYDINDDIKVGVYSGFTHLIGKHIDAIPTLHTNNFIVDMGIKMSINVGLIKSMKKTRLVSVQSYVPQSDVEPSRLVAEEIPVQEEVVEEIKFPVIYFPFNKSNIVNSELDKVIQIADILKKNPSMRVKVVGWADEVGTFDANKRISVQRANTVKQVLMRMQISGDRIEATGEAVNYEALTHDAARNVTVIEIK